MIIASELERRGCFKPTTKHVQSNTWAIYDNDLSRVRLLCSQRNWSLRQIIGVGNGTSGLWKLYRIENNYTFQNALRDMVRGKIPQCF